MAKVMELLKRTHRGEVVGSIKFNELPPQVQEKIARTWAKRKLRAAETITPLLLYTALGNPVTNPITALATAVVLPLFYLDN